MPRKEATSLAGPPHPMSVTATNQGHRPSVALMIDCFWSCKPATDPNKPWTCLHGCSQSVMTTSCVSHIWRTMSDRQASKHILPAFARTVQADACPTATFQSRA